MQEGDVLSRLAIKFKTTTKTLMFLNDLKDVDDIYADMILYYPA